jgi:hypothetical protein
MARNKYIAILELELSQNFRDGDSENRFRYPNKANTFTATVRGLFKPDSRKSTVDED